MEEVMIQIEKLNKSYGSKHVLKNINLKVYKGECLGIIGKNGAGKTTLLECVENIRKWESGIITVQGVDREKNAEKLKQKIGVQLQSSSLPGDIKVVEAIQLFAAEHSVYYETDIYNKFGLQQMLQKRYKQLSTGQKRRLHLLIAILHNPEVVILDEPTAGLDIEGKEQLYHVIEDLKNKGKTILITSHDMTEVEKLCDRVAFVIDGQIVKIDEMSKELTANKEAVVCIKMKNGSGNYIGDINMGSYKRSENGYDEYHCTEVAVFLKELMETVIFNKDTVQDIYIRKSSIERELTELIKGE